MRGPPPGQARFCRLASVPRHFNEAGGMTSGPSGRCTCLLSWMGHRSRMQAEPPRARRRTARDGEEEPVEHQQAGTPWTFQPIGRKAKLEVVASKPCATPAISRSPNTPGVAEPCLEIEEGPRPGLRVHGQGNLVAVISNGTAVLGLGKHRPPFAGKAGHGGKRGCSSKRFADIDVFDIEVAEDGPGKPVHRVRRRGWSPPFGGIKPRGHPRPPSALTSREKLQGAMGIPVFHERPARHPRSSPPLPS